MSLPAGRVYSADRLAAIVSHWAPVFRRLGDSALPVTYLAYDVETSGFSRQNDVVLEWGHCLVHNRQPVDRLSVIINWFDSVVPSAWLEAQLKRVALAMRQAGRPWHLTADRIRREGVAPRIALAWIHRMLKTAQDAGCLLVGHNACNFDNAMLAAHFAQDLGVDFEFQSNAVLDTGAIAKAVQMHEPRALPQAGDTLRSYFKRITDWRVPGVKWSLDGYCVPVYGLADKPGVDEAKLHAAGEDAYVVHLLVEEFRRLVDGAEKPAPPATPTPVQRAPALLVAPLKRWRGQRSS